MFLHQETYNASLNYHQMLLLSSNL
uniref:Uncharacterized protein n=1 Tax=Medicago truncatula TaxID=3880 RepID=I3SZH8_MEDTR|nr:unknown [Medicago truncatula]